MLELLKQNKSLLPTLFIIFGAAGDLTHKKLIPAIYDLAYAKKLPEKFEVLGVARRELNPKQYRESLQKALKGEVGKVSRKTWDKLSPKINYMTANFEERSGYAVLTERIHEFRNEHGSNSNVIFYLATPPSTFYSILQNFSSSDLHKIAKEANTRIVLEKPFGENLKSAEMINKELKRIFKEEQVYRIDHYLGKETIQNLLIFRFANQIFTPAWDRNSIDHIQISILEENGLESRGNYYDNSGALRDIIQNHALEVLAHIAMEQPKYFDEHHIRDERTKVLESLKPYSQKEAENSIVRGQYEGYRNEQNVNRASHTETYVAMKLFIENDRWLDVPIYIRTGKKLKEKLTTVVIKFKDHTKLVISADYRANTLVYKIQPNEGVDINLLSKIPGKDEAKLTNLHFNYSDEFEGKLPSPYETLLLDVMLGDPTLFVREDEIDAGWKFIDHIRDHWNKMTPPSFPNYKVGSIGPESAEELIKKDGRRWIE